MDPYKEAKETYWGLTDLDKGMPRSDVLQIRVYRDCVLGEDSPFLGWRGELGIF